MADVLERDAGFCSGGDEIDGDDIEGEDGIHSPTDASEDSVDVKVQAISFRNRNKRKCAEPRKLDSELPAKKRKLDLSSVLKEEVGDNAGRNPFRPWSTSPPPVHRRIEPCVPLPLRVLEPSERMMSVAALATSQYLPRGCQLPVQRLQPLQLPTVIPEPIHQDEPLSLVYKRKDENGDDVRLFDHVDSRSLNSRSGAEDIRVPVTSTALYPPRDLPPVRIASPHERRTSERGSYPTNRVKLLDTATAKTNSEKKSKPEPKIKLEEVSHSDSKFRIDSLLSSAKAEGSASTSKSSHGGQQRNYKNMTRERRIEANARERTRVHTISAAFDTLRHSIPAYSHNQKLSKLSVLRIACSYIMTLSRLAGHDYSKDQSEPDLSSCVDNVSKTIQTEGKIRKKRDD